MLRKKCSKIKNPAFRIKKRIWICAAAGAFFISFCAQWGSQLDSSGNVDVRALSTWLLPLVSACVLTPVLAILFSCAGSRKREERAACRENEKFADHQKKGNFCAFWTEKFLRLTGWWNMQGSLQRILLRTAALFICWLPVFLAVYPGFFAYDATDELDEVLNGEYVTRHPLLHVLMLGKTVAVIQELTGSFNAGIAVYVLAQMAVMGLLCSWVLEELKKIGAGRILGIVSFLLFGFFPVIPMYVLCTSKDMPYTAGLLALIVLLLKMCREKGTFWKKKTQVIGLGTALFVTAAFRSNGFGVFLLTIPALVWLAEKKMRKRALALTAVVFTAYFGVQAGLNAALQPESTNAMEGFTVPIQQLARTWNYSPEIFSQEDREALFEILPEELLGQYKPKISDPVKNGFQTYEFQKNPERYIQLWLKIGLKSPLSYMNAWMMTSYGFWYPSTVIEVYNGILEYKTSSYFSCQTEFPGERHSYFPWLERQYEKISWEKEIHETPVISWLFSPGALCWVWMLGGLFLIAVDKRKEAAALLPVYFNFLTVLIGPTYLVRYVLIFWFGLPVLLSSLSAVWYTSKKTQENETVGKSAQK